MIRTHGASEYFKGSAPSVSPTALPEGIFSLCSGGVPTQGAFGRLPGKSLRALPTYGGAISIYQFGRKVVIQRFAGIEIYDISELAPNESEYLTDNAGNLVYNNHGIPITV